MITKDNQILDSETSSPGVYPRTRGEEETGRYTKKTHIKKEWTGSGLKTMIWMCVREFIKDQPHQQEQETLN